MEFNLPTIISLVTLATVGVNVLIGIRKPNEDQNVVIAEMKTTLLALSNEVTLMKQNHLPHIETSLNNVTSRLTRIETILEERLPKK